MPRFFTPQLNAEHQHFKITDPSEVHHIQNVLKLKVNDSLEIFNGIDRQASGTIIQMSAKCIDIKIISNQEIKTTPTHRFILACAIPKKGKFETIIEKTTELGIDEIIPLQTHRTQVILEGERLQKKIKRYETVAINAAKQSQRTTIPIIHSVQTFKATIQQQLELKSQLIIPSLEDKTQPILESFTHFTSAQRITFFIGPEGDFTTEEYKLAKKSGCIPVSLGQTILKVETAAISTIACAQMFFRKDSCPRHNLSRNL